LKEPKELLPEMRQWMHDYMKTFYTDDAKTQQGILVKEEHTGYVTGNCRALAQHLGLSAHDSDLAEIMGLFHDVGRFRQFALYQTFVDAESEDHADLGLKVLAKLPFLQELPPYDCALVRFAIGNHNKKDIAPTDDSQALLMARILRDADKLDIYRVLAPYIAPSGTAGRGPSFRQHELGEGGFSEGFLERFVRGEQCDYDLIRTMDDRKLVRLMWVYDVNFAWTLQRIVDRGYVDLIIRNLPQGAAIERGIRRMKEYIRERLAAGDQV
jgi:hypothetical protein